MLPQPPPEAEVDPRTDLGASVMRRDLEAERCRLGQRGTVLIQFVLVLPVLLILVFGSFALWKVVSAKQSLISGTYQAARYLSV